MNQPFSMKLLSVVTLSVTGLVLGSFCFPEPARSRDSVDAGNQPGNSEGEDGAEAREPFIISNPLSILPRDQEGYYSCWATCAEMVMEFLGGGRVRQCEQVHVAFPLRSFNCCVGDGVLDHGLCDAQWRPEFEKWGFDFDFRSKNPLTWEQLTTEIDEGRPFAFSWVVQPPVSHMMVLVGYDEIGGERRVTYLEPWYGSETDAAIVPFSYYDGSSGDYPHRDDYFRIRPSTFQ